MSPTVPSAPGSWYRRATPWASMGSSSAIRSSTVSAGRKRLRSHPAQGPMGISSMNRISQGCSRLRFTKSSISSSLNPPMRTVSNFRFRNPAASAALMPASTSWRVPSRVMAANRSGRSVSRLMFSRSTPASRRARQLGQEGAVGSEAQLRQPGDGPQHPAQVRQSPPHQRPPAGEADLLYPAPNRRRGDLRQLFDGEYRCEAASPRPRAAYSIGTGSCTGP